ncbi:MAG: hypothetical protein JO151_16980, partial [Verrucomicrobia bacterium]|nr:hypothetical protein [Verrucomicrobiota bacterium]
VQSGPNPIHVEAVDGNGVKTANDYTLTVTGVGNKNYQYDLNGNLVSDGDNTYSWDSQNRLTGIQGAQTGGNQLQFTYDSLGRNVRIVQLNGGSVVADHRFIWVGLERCEERDASGNVLKRFFPQGEVVGGTPRYFLKDHLGSIRAVAESDGSISMQYDYSPWGEQSVISGNNPADFGFTGHYTGVGPTLAPYRLYNPQLGRWISRDPIGEGGGLNLYAYVGNDPGNRIDPTGEAPADMWLSVAILGTALAGPEIANAPGPCDPTYASHGPVPVVIGVGTGVAGEWFAGKVVAPFLGKFLGRFIGSGAAGTTAKTGLSLGEEIGILRSAASGKGNFALGSANASDAMRLGRAWVGDGATVASDGTALVSKDGLRIFRPPSFKPKLGKFQANFEQKNLLGSQPFSNGHLDILFGPGD